MRAACSNSDANSGSNASASANSGAQGTAAAGQTIEAVLPTPWYGRAAILGPVFAQREG